MAQWATYLDMAPHPYKSISINIISNIDRSSESECTYRRVDVVYSLQTRHVSCVRGVGVGPGGRGLKRVWSVWPGLCLYSE